MEKIYTAIPHAKMLIDCVSEAGKAIMNVYDNDAFWVETKEDKSPLTSADILANDIILSHLTPTSIPILSEESAHAPYSARQHWKQCWVVDPIDGTKEFIKKNGEFTINIALVINKKSELGIIYAPAMHKLFIGQNGHGAYQVDNFGKENQCISELPLPSSNQVFRVLASKSHMNTQTKAYITELKEQHANLEISSIGSSLKICLVASNSANIYPRFAPTMEWDTAAGHAIVKAAGKNIYFSTSNEELTYNKEDLLNPHFVVK
jgi:3'(2'), 5'-bisphosphate nucleotidase